MKFCQKVNLILCFGFLLGVYKGHIALWQCEDPMPVEVFPFRVTSLPPADQETLHQGIRVNSGAELARLLEDYLS